MGRKTFGWLFSLCLFGSVAAHAGSPVWAIHGAHNTVYLAGSVHLLKAADASLPPGFDRAYKGSKAIVMELAIDKIDPTATAQWMMENGMLKGDKTLRAEIGEERYQRVSKEAERLGIPMEAADMLQPWVLGLQLVEMQYMQLGFDPQQGVEQQLEREAQADGKPISGLETMDEQLGVLQSLSKSDQARFLDMTVSEMHDVEAETQSVVTAWRSGDAAKLAALLSAEYKSFPNLYEALVTERNKRWVPQIERLLHGNQDVFVVVGALHLVGDGGLLELMRRDGYKAEQLN